MVLLVQNAIFRSVCLKTLVMYIVVVCIVLGAVLEFGQQHSDKRKSQQRQRYIRVCVCGGGG
jgi:hypothetical protein